MEQIGLEAVFRDAEFQQGLARYTAGVARMQDTTTRAALSMGNSMTAFSHTFSTAVGTVVGIITAQLIPQLQRAMTTPIDSLRAWGGQLDTLRDEFGMSGAEASQWAVSMSTYMGSVDEGASGLSAFVRNLNNMSDGLKTAGAQYSTTMQDISAAHAEAMARIAEDWKQSQADAAESIADVWSELASRRADIEENLSDTIADINANLADRMLSIREDLQDRLDDIARERADVERDLTKSLSRLEEDYRDRMRNARSAKERRQIRKDAAERKRDLVEQAAERRAELDRQEAEARKNAEKQMALAEKLAAKQVAAAEKAAQRQIEAAEKAAQKQTEAIEKALAKQMLAMQRATAEQEKQYAKQQKAALTAVGKSGTSDPIAKALKQLGVNAFTAEGKVRPFAELMPEIMDAFKKLPPGINASAIAMQLFGRGGSKFLDFLRQGREGLIKARQEAEAWGLVLSNEDTDAIEEFGYELNRLRLQFQGLGITVGRELLPYVSQFVGWLRNALTEVMPAFQNIIKRLSEAFKTGGLEGLGKEFWTILTEPKGVFERLGAVMAQIQDWFTNGDGKKILEAIGVGFSIIVGAFTAWVESPQGRKMISQLTRALADAIFAGIKLLFSSDSEVRPVMNALVDTLRRLADALWSVLATIGSEIGGSVISGIVSLFAGQEAANKIRDGITTVFNNGLNAILKSGIGNLFGKSLAEIAMYGFIETWKQLFSGFNPFGQKPAVQAPQPQAPGPTPNTTNTTSGLPYFDVGGWVRRTGPALVHAGEYVLNPMQARVMAPVLASPNYARTTYNFNHTWNGGAGGMDRTEIERIVQTATYRSIRQVVGSG